MVVTHLPLTIVDPEGHVDGVVEDHLTPFQEYPTGQFPETTETQADPFQVPDEQTKLVVIIQ